MKGGSKMTDSGTDCSVDAQEEKTDIERISEVRASNYETEGHRLRRIIKLATAQVKEYVARSRRETPRGDDSKRLNHAEMIDSAKQAEDHLEYAAMRIGKCIQAYNGGTSILDKLTPEELAKFNAR
jgi:hypothetical protein